MLAADVVTVGFRDGAQGHLADLRSAAHNNDALAVDAFHGGDLAGFPHHAQSVQVVEQRLRLAWKIDFKNDARLTIVLLDDFDAGDVSVVAGNRSSELMQYAGS